MGLFGKRGKIFKQRFPRKEHDGVIDRELTYLTPRFLDKSYHNLRNTELIWPVFFLFSVLYANRSKWLCGLQ